MSAAQVRTAVEMAFRDFATAGVPASGEHEPIKSEIRFALGALLETTLSSIGAGILRYPTKAALDAVTDKDDGQLAYVYGDPTPANNTVYQWDDGGNAWDVATWYFDAVAGVVQPLVDDAEAARDAAIAAADLVSGTLLQFPNTDITLAVVDEYGFARLVVTADGALRVLSLEIDNLDVRSVTAGEIVAESSDGIVQAWVDNYGLAVAILYSDGRLESAAGIGQAALANPDGFARAATFDARAPVRLSPGGIHMVIANGQSKHRGYNSFPPISTDPSPVDLKLSGGLITTDRGDYSAEVFVPLAEAQVPGPVNDYIDGETIISGACQMVHALIEQVDGVPVADQGFALFACAVGVSGAGLYITDPAAQPYERSIDVMERANTLATAAGKMFSVAFAVIEHGQTDTDEYTPPATFKAAWSGWRNNIEAAGEALTGDRRPFLACLTQTSDHPAYEVYDPQIALAQGELDAVANMVCAAPTYIFPTGGTDGNDGVHYSPLGSKLNGVYQGIAVYWRYYKGVDWHPLKPLGKDVKGRAVYVHMNVPVRPLRLATDLVTDPGNYGFRLKKTSDGTVIPIASVRVEGDDVVIVAGADLPSQNAADVRVEYAHGPTAGTPASGPTTGARGCLRDSQGDYMIFDPQGIARRLDNYCLIFRL